MQKIRPFLKWAGNKYHCLDKILAHLPPAERLIEPFGGSGAVFLNTSYPQSLIAENNADLVHLYRLLQTQKEDFIRYCQTYFIPENNDKEVYLSLRSQFNRSQDPLERAGLFLYLNRHSFNGLCRYNSKGGFNVPFGAYRKPYFPTEEMRFFYQKAAQAEFTQADFRQTFARAKAGDVIYCDPPYLPLSTTADFTAYTGVKFSLKDQQELAELALKACQEGAWVLISNHDTATARDLYSQAQMISFKVPRFISCQGISRRPAKEVLAIFAP